MNAKAGISSGLHLAFSFSMYCVIRLPRGVNGSFVLLECYTA